MVLLEDDASPDWWTAALKLGVERALDLDEAALWLGSSTAAPVPARALLVAKGEQFDRERQARAGSRGSARSPPCRAR